MKCIWEVWKAWEIFQNINIPLIQATNCKIYISMYIDINFCLQLKDEATVNRLQSLIKGVERLKTSILQPLDDLRREILEQMSAVELQHQIWLKQLNRSLTDLAKIDDYLSANIDAIYQNHTTFYIERCCKVVNPLLPLDSSHCINLS